MEVRASEIPSVHKEILVPQALLRKIRSAYISCQSHHRSLHTDVHHFIDGIGAQKVLYSEFQRLGRLQHENIPVIVRQGKPYVRPCERDAGKFGDYVFEFHVVRLEELSSGRNIVEQVSHLEIRPLRNRNRFGRAMHRIGELHLAAQFILLTPCSERHLGNCRNRCQGLSPESKGCDVHQVVSGSYFGGCVSLKTEYGIVRRHSATVVNHLYQSPSCIPYHNSHLGRPCIHRILNQLFDHRCRTLNDLSRSYRVGDI